MPKSTLVLTRPDGSTYAFPDVTVSCEPPMASTTAAGAAAGSACTARSRSTAIGESDAAKVAEPFVYFEGNVSKIEGDRTFAFPNDWSWTPSTCR